MTGKRAAFATLALLAGCALARPACAQQPAAQLVGYSLHRVEVSSSPHTPASLADRLRDALAARLVPGPGTPATVSVRIAQNTEINGEARLWAIVAVRDDTTGRDVTEFDAEATTPVPRTGDGEALQAATLAESIAAILTQR